MAEIEKTRFTDVEGHVRKHTKGWGCEEWIENLPEYCGKVLHIAKGKRCSLHFHIKKLETMLLIKGCVRIVFIDPENGRRYSVYLDVGDSIRIPRGQVHQIIAREDSELVEFSTTHDEADSYRIEKGD